MKKYSLFILFIILFTSCNKSLVEKPKSFLSPAQFFNSDDEAIAAVNGAYSTVNYIYNDGAGTGGLGYWSPLGTDIARPTGGRESTFPFHTYTLSSSNEGNIDDAWTNLYKGVANCNMVIDGVTNNSGISSTVRNEVLGQALFLRSLYYYWLTCMWGDVPMWLGPLDVNKIGGDIPRTPVDSVRHQMINDLTVAATDLPSSWSGADLGRASKWAADMLLCKYYLWEKDWTNAKTIAGEIIEQKNGNHHLLANYDDIWGEANEYNPEDIWELDFTQNIHQQTYTDRFIPRQVDEPVVPGYEGLLTGFGLVTSTPEFLSTFDSHDLREKWYDWHGSGPVTTKFHYVFKMMDNFKGTRGNHGANILIYRMADAYLMYAEAENELNGPTTDAYEKINTIRERAGVSDLSGLSQDQFRLAVRNERKWELSFEFQRRWDLDRWGDLVEAVKSNAISNPQGAKNVQPYHQLAPIPSRELELNPALTQNQGY